MGEFLPQSPLKSISIFWQSFKKKTANFFEKENENYEKKKYKKTNMVRYKRKMNY